MNIPVLTIILLAPLVGALINVFMPKEEGKTIKIVSAIATGISLALTVYVYINYDFAQGGMQFIENIPWTKDLGVTYALGVDGISLPMLLLTNLIGFTSVFASWGVEVRPKEFFVLLLVLITGVMGTFVARDLFIFFLFYEVVVIPIYIMVLIWGSSKRVTKEYAGMKLTIYLLVGSAFLLAAMISLWVKSKALLGTPTFDIETLATLAKDYGTNGFDKTFQVWLFGAMAFGFATLLSMFPFHSWSPDGYAGAPTAVSMIHAGVLKKIGGYGLIRVGLFVLPAGAKVIAPIIIALAVGNVVYAALIALAQKDLKYVVGYSSVSHMGYVLIGIASLNAIGVAGAVATMFAHGVMAALFFSMVGYIYYRAHTRHIPDLGGLAHQLPRISTGFVIAALASAGLPGTVNFIPEFTVFLGTIKAGYLPVAMIIATGVILTAVYVLRAAANTLFGPRLEKYDHLKDIKGPEMVPLVVLTFALILFGVFPGLLMNLVNVSVKPLVAHIDSVLKIGGMF